MTELMPCPFCGGEATRPAQNPERVWCTNENCIMAFKMVLTRTWNTRTPKSPAPSADDTGKPFRAKHKDCDCLDCRPHTS
jgi:hypothetical protein